MLDPGLITREDLYEAVWSESVQKLAQALGISDVGLAKICKKLNVPRPGRDYWGKSPRLRKVLKKPLPALMEGQASTSCITGAAGVGGAGWTREALKTLAEEGIPVPSAPTHSGTPGTHPLLVTYRDLVSSKGWAVRSLVKDKACLALAVSEPALARGVAILQTIFEAFEAQGITPEVLPPQRARNSYGYDYDAPGRTGVRIKDIFLSFELREETRYVEVPPPPPAPPPKGRRNFIPDPPPIPTYRTEGTGELTLEILDPSPQGMRKRWKDGRKKVEDQLDGFFKAVLTIAEHAFVEEQERIRQKQAEAEAEARRQEAEARRAELAGRMYDLESRLMDVQQAQAIRTFAQQVRADAQNRGVPPEEGELQDWLRWAEGLANDLERTAMQTLSQRRRPPEPKPSYGHQQTQDTEVQLRSEVDLWRRRYIFGRR